MWFIYIYIYIYIYIEAVAKKKNSIKLKRKKRRKERLRKNWKSIQSIDLGELYGGLQLFKSKEQDGGRCLLFFTFQKGALFPKKGGGVAESFTMKEPTYIFGTIVFPTHQTIIINVSYLLYDIVIDKNTHFCFYSIILHMII